MGLRHVYTERHRLRQEVRQDTRLSPKVKALKESEIEDAWRQIIVQAFQLIPESLNAFIEGLAWNVFDDTKPGPLEEFLLAVIKSEPIKGHAIEIHQDHFAHFGITSLADLTVHMQNLNAAWNEISIHILVKPYDDQTRVEIRFFSM